MKYLCVPHSAYLDRQANLGAVNRGHLLANIDIRSMAMPTLGSTRDEAVQQFAKQRLNIPMSLGVDRHALVNALIVCVSVHPAPERNGVCGQYVREAVRFVPSNQQALQA